MNLLPFAHLSLYTLFAPNVCITTGYYSRPKINWRLKAYAKFLGANKVYHGRCAIGEWKFKIERKLAGDDRKRSTSSLFPFRRPLRAFFFPHPSSPPLRNKEEVAVVPWVRKTFHLRFRSLLRSSPRSIPPRAGKNLWYQGYWMANTNWYQLPYFLE